MKTILLNAKLKEFLLSQISEIAKTNPMISFIKPILNRIVDKNFHKTKKFLDLIADETGDIDIETLLPEMIDSVMNTSPFTFKTDFMGDIELGGGLIKLNIPVINKTLIFNGDDLETLKDILSDGKQSVIGASEEEGNII